MGSRVRREDRRREEESQKDIPEQAEEIMRIVGTQGGQEKYPDHDYMKVRESDGGKPRFRLYELQDSYQLKGYLGKAHSELVKSYNSAVTKAEKNRVRGVVICDDEESDSDTDL